MELTEKPEFGYGHMKYWGPGFSANHKTKCDRLTSRCNLTEYYANFKTLRSV